MKWSSLLKDIKEKVGISSQQQAGSSSASDFSAAFSAAAAAAAAAGVGDGYDSIILPGYESAHSSPASRFTTISGSSKQDSNEGSRLFKIMAKSFSKRWQNEEISNFQCLMHLNTLAGRGYSDLTQYPVFPWVLADYESDILDLTSRLDKPMGCQTAEGEEEFKKRYESWDDPDVQKFHYGSHYSSTGIVLFYLLRLPPFSAENQTLQGGQFDHADRLFNSIRDTWLSAAGKGTHLM